MLRIPNLFIHLGGFLRPERLRPDLRVPNIAYVDFRGLRAAGFNAVVVDKDNCITLPEKDEVYQPLHSAWSELLSAFPPGRVLVVSNSAGTPKDPSSIAAESVALNLRAPVLVRKTPKPGCAPEIIAYFNGDLGRPTTLRGRIHDETKAIKGVEEEDEKVLLGKWIDEAERGPLLGPLVDAEGRQAEGEASLRDKMVEEEVKAKPEDEEEASISTPSLTSTPPTPSDLRILVVGDRLFTDTLLADRLSRLLPKPTPETRTVLSIHTTALPQPNDVPLLRWVEDRLTGGKLKADSAQWQPYVRDPYAEFAVPPLHAIEAETRPTLADKWNDLRGDIQESRLEWDPRTWTAFDLAVGAGRGLDWAGRTAWHGAKVASAWIAAQTKHLCTRLRTPQPTKETVAPSILEGRRIE